MFFIRNLFTDNFLWFLVDDICKNAGFTIDGEEDFRILPTFFVSTSERLYVQRIRHFQGQHSHVFSCGTGLGGDAPLF